MQTESNKALLYKLGSFFHAREGPQHSLLWLCTPALALFDLILQANGKGCKSGPT